MICPHCGRNTNAADICQHCHKPTEFTPRFNSRPGTIPGLEDRLVMQPDPVKPPKKDRRTLLCLVMSTLACALSIICLLQIGRLSRKEELPPVSVSETTSIPVVDCVVTFEWNLQEKNEWIPSISKGGTMPTLQDSEEYLFTGWNTDPNGNGTSFYPGEIFDLELKQDLTLFAQWAPAPEQTEPTEPTEPETEATNAAQEVDPSDASALDAKEVDPSDASAPDAQDSNTQASASDLLSAWESEGYYG